MVFENRHMLVGGRVEYDVRAIALERVEKRRTVVDVDERLATGSLQGGRSVVKMGLVMVEKDEFRRTRTPRPGGRSRSQSNRLRQ